VSTDVPEYHPLTERRPERRKTGETCSEGAAPTIRSVPLIASPPWTLPIASPLVAVARMTAAPPSFCSSAAGSWAWLSMYPAAPSLRACGSLSLPRAMPRDQVLRVTSVVRDAGHLTGHTREEVSPPAVDRP